MKTSSMNLSIKQHISWEMQYEVYRICKPLFDHFNINYFDYARFYKNDHEAIILYSDANWVAYFLNDTYVKPSAILKEGNHLWAGYIPPEIISVASKKFNHEHGVTLCYNRPTYDEIFNFSASRENYQVLQLYTQQTSALEKFCGYFLEKAESMIIKLEQQKLTLPSSVSLAENASLSFEQKCKVFLEGLNIHHRHSLQTLAYAKSKKITPREFECLYQLSKGLTVKQIARTLNLSPRTVEVHLNHLKEKLECKRTIEIFAKIKGLF